MLQLYEVAITASSTDMETEKYWFQLSITLYISA